MKITEIQLPYEKCVSVEEPPALTHNSLTFQLQNTKQDLSYALVTVGIQHLGQTQTRGSSPLVFTQNIALCFFIMSAPLS